MNCIFMFTIKILLNLCTLDVDVNTNQKTLRLIKRVSRIKRNAVNIFEHVLANTGKINTNISTVKCYYFDLEGDDIENSSFLIEIEEKISHIAYNK